MKKNVFYICGPTTSGKTAVSLELAKRIPNAIFINTDTLQLYKLLEPIAGAPTQTELSTMDHRLFGVLSVEQTITQNELLKLVTDEIKAAFQQGKQPILIGGARSFTSCVAKAAYNIEIHGEAKSRAALLRDRQAEIPAFPFNLRTIIVSPNVDESAILNRVNDGFEDGLKAFKDINNQQNNFSLIPRDYWTNDIIGIKELSGFDDGTLSRDEAARLITERAVSYARRQKDFFEQLRLTISTQCPQHVKAIEATDMETRLSEILDYMEDCDQKKDLLPRSRHTSPRSV